jgi:hypothetical protein
VLTEIFHLPEAEARQAIMVKKQILKKSFCHP